MSTQHPDNAIVPEWSDGDVLEGDAEVYEAYLAFQSLKCGEVMWDSEGKDADIRVVRKLLNKFGDYFLENVLGEDIFLTYRIPNPRIDIVERKIIVETLQNIPVSSDVASAFYKREAIPIFEVILPFTTDAKELIGLHDYYRKAIVATEEMDFNGSMLVRDWIGSFAPKSIEVIPLVEDIESILHIDKILDSFIDAVKPRYLRVFLARSDPALNYGLFASLILSKIGLSKAKSVEVKTGVEIHPILGVGSTPFRGHLSPENLDGFLQEYKGISTVTIQSALKYDYPLDQTKHLVNFLNKQLPNGQPDKIGEDEEQVLLKMVTRLKLRYQNAVELLAPLINSISAYVPRRRTRKLHIGLFGYTRNVQGVILPRAIPFAASFYSIGIPPEFIGAEPLNNLSEDEWNLLRRYYLNLKHDFGSAARYVSWQGINIMMDMYREVAKRASMGEERLKEGLARVLEDLKAVEESLEVKLGPRNLSERRYENVVSNFLISYIQGEEEEAKVSFIEAAKMRKCLG